MSSTIPPLDLLLEEVSRRRLILSFEDDTLECWSPNTKLPVITRRAIRKHRTALLHLLASADVRVCCCSDLHRETWHNDTCKRLDASLMTIEQDIRIAS